MLLDTEAVDRRGMGSLLLTVGSGEVGSEKYDYSGAAPRRWRHSARTSFSSLWETLTLF